MTAAAAQVRPDFHDERLRQALDEAAPAIESFTSRLDRLSNDIKNLETYLERSAVRIETDVRVPDSGRPWDVDDDGTGQYLSWAKGEPDRWRVIYFRIVRDPGDGELSRADRLPLIEAPLEVRVKTRSALPLLLNAVARAAMLGEADIDRADPGVPPPDDDIPF